MRTKTIGNVLIVIGLIMIACTEFNFSTTKNVIDLSEVKINKEKNLPNTWSPIIALVLIFGGIAIIEPDKKISN